MDMTRRDRIRGLVFDKDGTLFDFHATWSVWARRVIEALAEGEPAKVASVAEAMHFDLETNLFLPSSPFIAHTNRECCKIRN